MKKLILTLPVIGLFAFIFITISNASASSPNPNELIKSSSSAVYFKSSDDTRYVFPTEKTYESWFIDFRGVVTVSDETLSGYPLVGNITNRPGYKMVKITTDPKVYVVDKGGVLRWVTTEEIALALYGDDWGEKIDDVPDGFFVNYTIGEPINDTNDINLWDIFANTKSISDDKNVGYEGYHYPLPTTDFIGIKQSTEISTSCNTSNDCTIINKEINYRSCWPGRCELVDYSLERYISVNKDSFQEFRNSEIKFRPSEAECYPAPGCNIAIINENFESLCTNNSCTKSPKHSTL